MAYLDLIDGAYAILTPALSGYAADDAALLAYISAASARIQRYLNREYTEAEVAALDADIKTACAALVALMLVAQDGGEEFSREQLGDYQYEREDNFTPGPIPAGIRAMLPLPLRIAPRPQCVHRHHAHRHHMESGT